MTFRSAAMNRTVKSFHNKVHGKEASDIKEVSSWIQGVILSTAHKNSPLASFSCANRPVLKEALCISRTESIMKTI